MNKFEDIKNIAWEYEQFKRNDFVVRKTNYKKGFFMPLHWHDYFELEFILKGSIIHQFNKNRNKISEGSAFLLSYYDTHEITMLEDTQIINIRFSEKFLPKKVNEYMLSKNKLECFFNEKELNYIVQRVEQFYKQDKNSVFYDEITANIISEIIYLVINKLPTEKNNLIPTPVQETITYIIQNFREDISLNSAAKKLSLTSKYLGVIFKENTNTTFHEYLNNVRLNYSCNLLASSDLTVKEIAFMSGYNSVEHFLLTFKKHFNLTPSKYRGTFKSGINK